MVLSDMDQTSASFKALSFYGTRMHHPGQWRVHSELRRALGADSVNSYIEVERAGLRWVLNPADHVQQNLFWLGQHDRWDISHIKQMLPPNPVLCDIGANFGYYSVTLAASLKPDCRIFAFEPHPKTRTRLERHIALNQLGDLITVLPCALSDVAGTVQMSLRESNSGAAHISQHGDTEVEVSTLDSICADRQFSRLDFVKIDVEGFETRVLKGGSQCLQKLRPKLLVEMMPEQLERTGSSAAELASTLRDYGYRLHVSDRRKLLPLTTLPTGSDLINVFCLP